MLRHSSACFYSWIDIINVILSTERHEYEFEIDVHRRTYRSPRQDRRSIGSQSRRRAAVSGVRACQAFARRDGGRSLKSRLWPWSKGKSRPEIPQPGKSKRN